MVTFLAPAERCNQRCPACIIHAVGEPVHSFELSPNDYVRFTEQLRGEGFPIAGITFQGYEVTLPRSWPYVEAVFGAAKRWNIRRSFITNGMLLSRRVRSIRSLEPGRITVSLDGADARANDVHRGLDGAFEATVRSIEHLLTEAPDFRSRVAVASTMYDEDNVRSLSGMPALLARLGITRWALSFELKLVDGREVPAQPRARVAAWAERLVTLAEESGLRVHLNDEFGFFRQRSGQASVIRAKHVFSPDHIIRFQPGGYVRIGREITQEFDPARARRWSPQSQNAGLLLGLTAAESPAGSSLAGSV